MVLTQKELFWKGFVRAVEHVIDNMNPDFPPTTGEDVITIEWEFGNPDGREGNEQFMFRTFAPVVVNWPTCPNDRWQWDNAS